MSHNTAFEIRITDNSFAEIRWARIPTNPNSKIKAEFSMDVYVDNILFCTMNSLAIKETYNKKTRNTEAHIQSMNKQVPAGDKTTKLIYSNTFFPKEYIEEDGEETQHSQLNIEQKARREQFVNDVISAVAAFLKEQVQYVPKKAKTNNTQLQALDKVRSLMM